MNERKPGRPSDNETDNTLQCSDDREKSLRLSPHRPWAPNISNTLKAPLLPNVDTDSISQAQAYAGISVHIPGSPLMEEDDVIVFHWGINQSSTRILQTVGLTPTVRVLCVAYNFIPHIQYGLVDVYFEVFRRGKRIGISPATMVTVNRDVSKGKCQGEDED